MAKLAAFPEEFEDGIEPGESAEGMTGMLVVSVGKGLDSGCEAAGGAAGVELPFWEVAGGPCC